MILFCGAGNFCLFPIQTSAAETNSVSTNSLPANVSARERAKLKLQNARAQFFADTNTATAAWQLGQACFEWNELAKDIPQQEGIAKEGITASRQAVALSPKSATAHYYLGLTIGQFADTKRNMAALKMVKEMEHEFLATRELDEHFDFAGADRNLGLLYHQAPTFISIGNRAKARQHLQRAVELAPDFPENRLNLIETLMEWSDIEEARQEIKGLEKSWPTAQSSLQGADWEAEWLGWQKRLEAAKRKISPAAR
jgi:tetratricopeptide (TPR) repeat protein